MDNAAKETWEKMLPILEKELSILSYDVWIKTLAPSDICDGKLVLVAATEYGKEFVNTRYLPLIKAAMQMINPLLTDVNIITATEMPLIDKEGKQEEEPVPVRQDSISINLKYNFESFVVGKANQLAVAAAKAVASDPGNVYNPLFIYGGAGLGKTHLMHAIGNYIRVANPSLKVLIVSSERFVNDLVAFIGGGKTGGIGFRDKYRSCDVLMVDDIQFISGKTATTEEMFHTFNELHALNKQLVFTSDRPPKEIPDIDERLRSRFEWGFTADIQPPDFETRIAILRKKAQMLKCNISLEVLNYMAECMTGNVREMEGLLNKVILLSQLNETSPSLSLVKEALKDYGEKQEGSITVDDVIDATCKVFSVTKADLVGKKKTKEIVEPRQVCIYIITELLDIPLATIGNIFGGRDHTTIMYARDKVSEKLNTSVKTATDVNNIKNMIYNK